MYNTPQAVLIKIMPIISLQKRKFECHEHLDKG